MTANNNKRCLLGIAGSIHVIESFCVVLSGKEGCGLATPKVWERERKKSFAQVLAPYDFLSFVLVEQMQNRKELQLRLLVQKILWKLCKELSCIILCISGIVILYNCLYAPIYGLSQIYLLIIKCKRLHYIYYKVGKGQLKDLTQGIAARLKCITAKRSMCFERSSKGGRFFHMKIIPSV